MADWFLDGFVAANMRETWVAGVKAWVHLYYHEYTDATEIEPQALRALLSLYDDWVSYDADGLELIHDAEKEINDAGGVMSATTNERHPVKTPSAWEDEDDTDAEPSDWLEDLRDQENAERHDPSEERI